MNTSTRIQSQLLATKFYIPVAPGRLISRPRLNALLDKGLTHPFILVSAPAGFGKTTFLSSWARSLQTRDARRCWVTLDEEDNDPRLFWSYALTALQMQCPERIGPLLMHLQSQSPPPLKSLLTALINLLAEGTDHFVLILDDYQVIMEKQVHTTLAYLIEHLPPQLHLILSTRADPPLPLSLLRAHQQTLEVRADQLRCTAEEVKAFFREVMGIQLSEEAIQQVTLRTEGWLVGLHMLGLSLRQSANPATLLQEVSGEQCYILDYLTEEVLRKQPQDVQRFLLCTSILERFCASLCDAVLEQTGSQQILQQLEQAHLFLTALDSKRQWYRYHALFAEALQHQLEWTHADLVPILHHRASLWYAQHGQSMQAIMHAFQAREWQWAADLIEGLPLMSLAWGADEHKLAMLKEWLGQLPANVVGGRPRLCLACVEILWTMVSHSMLEAWLSIAETMLMASLTPQMDQEHSALPLAPHMQQDLKDLLAEVMVWHAILRTYQQKGRAALTLCQQAESMLAAEKYITHATISIVKTEAYYASENDAEIAIYMGSQAMNLAHKAGQDALVLAMIGTTVRCMIQAGKLHEAERLVKQGMQLVSEPRGVLLPQVGWMALFQAETLREWNQLDAALAVIEEAIKLCKQVESIAALLFLFLAYAIQMRIFLSRTEMDSARCALKQLEQVSMRLNEPTARYYQAFFTTVDQVRLWLACGEGDQAMHWVKQREMRGQESMPFGHEREEVACARVFLATHQPDLALLRLEPVLQRATRGKRWGHVIEIRLLQALAYHMLQEETQALSALCEALCLAEPEGYIRSFVDEGIPMQALLSQLREQQHRTGPILYLNTLLAAFQRESRAKVSTGGPTKAQQLPEPLSERELQVLQLLARGVSNQEIADELVIALDTVKRHVSHIFSKLGANNRVQAIKLARELHLLGEKP